MIKVYVHEGGSTSCVDSVDPAWLDPQSQALFWVDLEDPTPQEAQILTTFFRFHELSVEDALAEIQHPKIESYGSYLYLVLHGIDFRARQHRFKTRDIDFFLHPRYLVTVRQGLSRSVGKVGEACARNSHVLAEGTASLLHRIIDSMVDNYRPEVDKLHERVDQLEAEVFQHPDPALSRRILDYKKDVASLRRVVLPERDAVGRLARREFTGVSEHVAYRFRDVHDHLVRLSDDATFLQDRLSGILDAHLSAVSNQLNSVMKVLTIIATIFMPLTVLTGMWGMNISLPRFPGGNGAQFWWVAGVMLSISAAMLVFFRRRRWI